MDMHQITPIQITHNMNSNCLSSNTDTNDCSIYNNTDCLNSSLTRVSIVHQFFFFPFPFPFSFPTDRLMVFIFYLRLDTVKFENFHSKIEICCSWNENMSLIAKAIRELNWRKLISALKDQSSALIFLRAFSIFLRNLILQQLFQIY